LKNPDELLKVLKEIEEMTIKGVIDIQGEEKLESEIISDLKRLSSKESIGETISLLESIGECEHIQNNILKIFQKIYQVLGTELHAIRLIKTKVQYLAKADKDLMKTLIDAKILLLDLFRLISNQEASLCRAFMQDVFRDKEVPLKVDKIARVILLEEELREGDANSR